MLQAIRECDGGLEIRLDLRGIARNAQAHRTNAMRADARIVSGEGVREPVVTRGVVASYPLGGIRKHIRGLARKVCKAPVVMEGFKLEVIVTELFADREQFVAAD